jgi:Rhodopirellula transposase DDE domain
MKQVQQEADADPTVLRLSLDAKATVKLGPFSRGGKSRVKVEACDHDFSKQKVTPWGILLPTYDELFLFCTPSKVTSDFIVDRIETWWGEHKSRFPQVKTLLLTQDNGPENHSRRTQFMARLVAFAHNHHINIRLAYYPPYHSKYNAIERCWGILEHHWNGALLDSVHAVLNYARTMTWKGKHPTVTLESDVYQTGVTLKAQAMAAVEAQLQRRPELGKWFVDINVSSPASA